jgi:precorrin-6B methylase 2
MGFLLVHHYLFIRNGVVNIPTNPRIRREIIDYLKKTLGARACTIVDLGSGNGQLAWHIARAFPNSRVIGLEIRPLGYTISCLRRHWLGPSNLEYRRGNFLDFDVSNADAIIIYLNAEDDQRVSEKLRKELKPGATILANLTKLSDSWIPFETIAFKNKKYWLTIYRQG